MGNAGSSSENPDDASLSEEVNTPSFHLSNNQKRWIVIGICLKKTLLSNLRDFLAQEMIKHYDDLKTRHNIDKQNRATHLQKDGGYYLNYGSINNNEGKKKTDPLFDFDVKSEVDMAKLYLRPFMAKFTGFDDTCNLVAVLGILSSASVFSSNIRDLARKVRQHVRNEWSRCSFLTWDEAKFTSSFQLMDSLVRELKLTPDAEKRITDELKDWEARVTPSFNLSDNQKRWIVVGIGLNKTLLSNLRDFLAQEMIKHYDDLKTKHNIDKQNLATHLEKDGGYNLNYGSINNNEGKKKTDPLFDFDVKSEVDLAKLYLKPFMTKFTGFDDTCNLSTALGILSSASVFSSNIRDLASKVRQDVRNEWSRCSFLTWDEAKFTSCFQLMDSLVRELKLPSDKEKRITDELKDWEARGFLVVCDEDTGDNGVSFVGRLPWLLKDSDETVVPAEILARGPEALQAYEEALKSGKTKNQRVLVTVVGPARAGKTSLLRSLKGEDFNPAEESTIGVVLQKAFCKPKENSWCEEDSTKDDSYNIHMAKTIAESLNSNTSQSIAEESATEKDAPSYPASTIASDISPDGSETSNTYVENRTSSDDLDDSSSSDGLEDSSSSDDESELTKVNSSAKLSQETEKLEASKISKEILDQVVNYLKSSENDDTTNEKDISFKTVDFAGQAVYEVLLPLFMSSKSIYILVYSLKNDLLEHAQSKVNHGNSERILENYFGMTNLEIIEFWLTCIASYTKNGSDSAGRTQVALPPVFVVCTHADECKQDPKTVARELCKLLTRPENPCGKHVMREVYAVDNTISRNKEIKDESVKRLKANIEELAKILPQVDEDIPLNWLKFEEELSNLVEKEQKKYIDLKEATRIAKKCNINTAAESKEFATLLNYLHDLKTIIYFVETRTVFIDTQWLIDMFVKVITVLPFEEWKDYADYWRKLEDEGVLQRALVEHVWKDIANDGQNTVDSLLLIMEMFSLICRWRLNDEEVFLVPCMLCNSETSEDIKMILADQKTSMMVIHFKSVHLPLGIFPRLVVAVAEHGKKEWPKVKQPEICPNFFRMYDVGDEGRFDICISPGIRTICIAVLNNHNIGSQSVTHFCQSVRNLLAQIFDDMRRNLPWMENMEFEHGIRCPVCPTSRKKCKFHKMEGCTRDSCLHFVSEKELENDHPKCYKFKTKTDNLIKGKTYAHWFPKKSKKTVRPCHLETTSKANEKSGNAVCQELVSSIGVQDLLTIDATTAANKVADYLQLNKSSMADPPDDVKQKCRAFCLQLKELGRHDIIKELRNTLPSGMTGPLLDDNTLYQDLEFRMKRNLTRALCGDDLWKWLASALEVPGGHLGYYGIQPNPAEAMLEDENNKKLTVGELYDKLLLCDAAGLADTYL